MGQDGVPNPLASLERAVDNGLERAEITGVLDDEVLGHDGNESRFVMNKA